MAILKGLNSIPVYYIKENVLFQKPDLIAQQSMLNILN